jgi:hypothetical protein
VYVIETAPSVELPSTACAMSASDDERQRLVADQKRALSRAPSCR